MSALAMSRRDRRTLTVGVFSVALIVAFGKGVPALRGWQNARVSAAADMRQTLDFEELGIASLPKLRDSVVARSRHADSLRDRLLAGPTPEAAAASLAKVIEHAAENEGMDVETVTFQADTVVRYGFARVTARITAQGDVDGVAGLLHTVETHRALLAVRSLLVTQPDPTAPTSRADALRMEISVQALAVIAGSSRRSSTAVPGRISPVAVLAAFPRRQMAFDPRAMDAALEAATETNAFRLSGLPSDVPYQPRSMMSTQTPVVVAPRPTLVLKGIVGGPPWQAIIDGIPGQQSGVVATAGAEFDRLVIRSVSRDSVVVRGADTTWVLTLDKKAP